jgi:hypothetical protein
LLAESVGPASDSGSFPEDRAYERLMVKAQSATAASERHSIQEFSGEKIQNLPGMRNADILRTALGAISKFPGHPEYLPKL